jgi:hypothetical protein
MLHFTAQVQCPMCSHVFNVCLHTYQKPGMCQKYTVLCPMNRSKVHLTGANLRLADSCPTKAVVITDENALR